MALWGRFLSCKTLNLILFESWFKQTVSTEASDYNESVSLDSIKILGEKEIGEKLEGQQESDTNDNFLDTLVLIL